LIIVVTLCAASLLFSSACAEKTPADETVSETPAEEIVIAQETPEAQTSQAAYEALIQEIRGLERSPSARQNVEQTVKKIETKLTNFISDWPGTLEASDAKYQLGLLFSNLMQPKKAISYLEEFLKEDPGNDNNRTAASHYFLAESYKNDNNFEAAKKHYQVVIDKYAAANTKILAMARNNLSSLDVMKRLAIGGEPIPFEVKDMAGKPLSLEKFKGKVVLLDFWATWCGPCRQEMPNVKRVYKKYNKEGFEIVGISLDNELGKVESYLKKNDVKWPQHFDGKGWSNGVAQKYKVSSIPATYLIDRKGKIRYKALRGAALDSAVDQLIKEK
jgi:thiol-disulfide isomerase/thioredoxin